MAIIKSDFHFISYRMIDVGEDGHMRLKCCGKIRTGIGNVPPYTAPRRKKTEYRNPLMDGEDMN